MKINILNMTYQAFDIEENLPGAAERIVIGPLSFDPAKIPQYALKDILRNKLDELSATPGFNPQDPTYILVSPNRNASLYIALFMSQAFWMLNGEPIVWILGDVPGSYLDTREMVQDAIGWVLDQQKAKLEQERIQFIQGAG